MLNRFATVGAFSLLALNFSVANASVLTLTNTYNLGSQFSQGASNFAPQGMGFDASKNELLFVQQSANNIIRTDLTGQVVGTRVIGSLPYAGANTSSGTANYVVSVAADAGNYYISDYTCNTSCRDLYSLGKTSGAAVAFSSENAAFGGYPIDVRDGKLYRTNASTSYSNSNLNTIRVSAIGAPDTTLNTLTLAGGSGIADFAVDVQHQSIWVLDYVASASIRRYDLGTGTLLETFAQGLDGMSGGLTYGNNTLYYYDWKAGSGSSLKAFSVAGLAAAGDVPEPGSLALFGLALMALGAMRKRARG